MRSREESEENEMTFADWLFVVFVVFFAVVVIGFHYEDKIDRLLEENQ